ncbi:MAG: hypothetical protein V8S27_00670 [Lachnospiraceae bacterium]
MIALALEECRKLGISEVLMCCKKTNLASARTIQKNGGVLENEVLDDGVCPSILDKIVMKNGKIKTANILGKRK